MATSTQQKATDSLPAPCSAPDGFRTRANGIKLLNTAKLQQLYADMLRCRLTSERLASVLREPSFRDVVGQEATYTGVLADILPADVVAPSERSLYVQLLKGITPPKIVLDCRATKAHGKQSRPELRVSHPDIIPATLSEAVRIGVASGLALEFSRRKEGNVVVLFAGLQSLPRSWNEMLSFAAQNSLPIVFVTQQDGAPAGKRRSPRATDYGFPSIPVAANDVVAVYRVAQESIHRARNGGGPTLIHCVDDPLAGGVSRDPLAHMKNYLVRRGIWSDAWMRSLAKDFKAELANALKSPRKHL